MAMLLWQFSYLQVLDALTTVAFLLVGVQEANPLVRLAMTVAPNPFWGIGIVKALGIGLGVVCALRGRHQLLSRINLLFAAVVVWNLAALILGMIRLA
jgi:hypothetical protein